VICRRGRTWQAVVQHQTPFDGVHCDYSGVEPQVIRGPEQIVIRLNRNLDDEGGMST
jgi:hypothetical protein